MNTFMLRIGYRYHHLCCCVQFLILYVFGVEFQRGLVFNPEV